MSLNHAQRQIQLYQRAVCAILFVVLAAFVLSTTGNWAGQTTPPHCGDGIVQEKEGEECDMGYRNKNSTVCNEYCKAPRCGDGILQPATEECEPAKASDGSYIQESCGGKLQCAAPVCTGSGSDQTCNGGCEWKFLPSCAATGSTVSSTGSITSTGSVATGSTVPTPASSASSVESAPSPVVTSAANTSSPATAPVVPDAAFTDTKPPDPSTTLPVTLPQIEPTSSASSSGAASAQPIVEDVPAAPVCGNATIEGGEQCDDGGANNDLLPSACRTNCMLPFCGDGVLDDGEECDDRNDVMDDGCSVSCIQSACGNGKLEQGEECDQGAHNSDSIPNSCSTRCLLPVCGDGFVDDIFGEECDTGVQNSNQLPDQCRITCMNPRCGDRVVDSGEECDDGNKVDTDACTSACTAMACGDGIVADTEQCDDGNTVDGDGCSAACVPDGSIWKRIKDWFAALFSKES